MVTVAALAGLCVAPAAYADLAVQHDSTVVTETAGNGNGIAEPGDTVALTENVMSVDPDQTFSSVSGTLSTSSPDATISASSSSYPDLYFAAPTGNATPYSVALSKTMECGVAIPMTVSLQTNAGPTDVSFTLPTGKAGASSSYQSADVPRDIPDNNTAGLLSNLTIPGSGGRVKHVTVRVGQLTHTYDGDLTLYLVAPNGQSVLLVKNRGGSGQNFANTVFDDSAATMIRSTTPAPFTGTYQPVDPLSSLDGAPLSGTWQLRVVDNSSGEIGTLDAWGLDIQAAVCAPQPTPVTDPPPPPPPPPAPHDCGQHAGQGSAFGLLAQLLGKQFSDDLKLVKSDDRSCPDHGDDHGKPADNHGRSDNAHADDRGDGGKKR